MILLMHLPEVLPIDMGVNLRGRDIGVAEHLLNRAQVRAALEQVGGERVTEGVRRHRLCDPRLFDVSAQNLPGSHSRKWLAAGVEKENSFPTTLFQARPQFAHIGRDGADRRTSNGNEPFLAALAED